VSPGSAEADRPTQTWSKSVLVSLNSKKSTTQFTRAPQSLSERYGTRILVILGLTFAVAYAALGDRVLLLGHIATLELDTALRSALVGRYDPGSVTPLTVVTIDDATAAEPTANAESWGFSDTTPRDKLAQMLAVISKSFPAATVVDVDLSDNGGASASGDTQADAVLRAFLESYSGRSLIFVKRAQVGGDGQYRLAPSRFDQTIAGNSRLSWAHALYSTDPDGTVRQWTEWLVVCLPTGPLVLPSVPLRILATWPEQARQAFPRPSALTLRGSCKTGISQSPRHIIIYDEALSGAHVAALSRDLSQVSAWQLLDARIKRDDTALFSDRVVLIGGTRSGSADLWRTPVGALPGVEVMANTIRFAPGQLRESHHALLSSLAFFGIFCGLQMLLRPIGAIAVGGALCATVIYFAGPYVTLDAFQSAIILFVELTIVEECVRLWLDARTFGWQFLASNHLRRSN
jgi:CHASE2 domain-containing sensor protein